MSNKKLFENYWNNITQKEESALPCISALSGRAQSNQAIEVPPTAARLQLWYWFFYIEVELVNGNLFNSSCSYSIYQLLFINGKVYYKFKAYVTGFIFNFLPIAQTNKVDENGKTDESVFRYFSEPFIFYREV